MEGIEKDRGGQAENQGGEKGQAARTPEPEAEKVDQHGQQGAEQSQEGAQQKIEQGRRQFEKKEGGQGQGDAGQVVGIDLFKALAPGAVGGQFFHRQEFLEAVAEILVEDIEVAVAGQGLGDGQVMGFVADQGHALAGHALPQPR